MAATAEEVLRPVRGWLGFLPGREKPAAAAPRAAPPKPKQDEGGDPNALEPTIYRFVLRHSLRQQLSLLALTLVSFPFLYYSLDLPKTIVNRAIGGKQFPQQFFGMEFSQIPYLLMLCTRIPGYWFSSTARSNIDINTLKGQLGERMLRRFRYQLYQRMLRFPLTYFSKTSSAQIIPMVTAECESLGGFIGDAFNTPAFQGGTLADDHFVHVHARPGAGRGCGGALPVAGLCDPETAAQGEPAQQAACAHDPPGRRSAAGIGSRDRRHSGQ